MLLLAIMVVVLNPLPHLLPNPLVPLAVVLLPRTLVLLAMPAVLIVLEVRRRQALWQGAQPLRPLRFLRPPQLLTAFRRSILPRLCKAARLQFPRCRSRTARKSGLPLRLLRTAALAMC